MSGTSNTPADDDSPEIVEIVAEGVDEEGDLVIDDLVVAVDSEGKVLGTDETIAIITPGGDAVVDEKISVMGEDRRVAYGRRRRNCSGNRRRMIWRGDPPQPSGSVQECSDSAIEVR
jgi:hypothetical protein